MALKMLVGYFKYMLERNSIEWLIDLGKLVLTIFNNVVNLVQRLDAMPFPVL